MRTRFHAARAALALISTVLLGACDDDFALAKPVIAPSETASLDGVVGDWFDPSDTSAVPSRDMIVRRVGDGYVVWSARTSFDKHEAGRPARLGYIGQGLYAQVGGATCDGSSTSQCFSLYRIALTNGMLRIYTFSNQRLGELALTPTSVTGLSVHITAGRDGPTFSHARLDADPSAARAFLVAYTADGSVFQLYKQLRRRPTHV
jgi:hypothetical protein